MPETDTVRPRKSIASRGSKHPRGDQVTKTPIAGWCLRPDDLSLAPVEGEGDTLNEQERDDLIAMISSRVNAHDDEHDGWEWTEWEGRR